MELIAIVQYGTPVLVLGMLLVLERILAKVDTIQEDVREIKEGMTWRDTCVAKHEEINRRFDAVEKKYLTA